MGGVSLQNLGKNSEAEGGDLSPKHFDGNSDGRGIYRPNIWRETPDVEIGVVETIALTF